ncbi:alpha-amylase 3, chloroplastic isoform X2 [Cornus florida]|uniref:alpha-amylase 3, chloroplastic isoform X2 n=1 Tax=Cornus florida TaxID=4283 RepID=UPI002899DBDE|nr:alpha-amylase 3, chloroplastic isoform X2 [Cornus florida]
MSTIALEPILHHCRRESPKFRLNSKKAKQSSINYTLRSFSNYRSFCNFRPSTALHLRASSTDTAVFETSESTQVFFKKTFPLNRTEKVEGNISIRLNNGKDQYNWELVVGCNIPGKWVLHWGVNFVDDISSEWDQPPLEMRPPGSIPIKDYAIETPLKKSSATPEGDTFQEVKIDFSTNSAIAAINFVLKDEETGAWYQHRGRDFKVPLVDYLHEDGNIVGAKKGFGIWPGALGQLSNILLNSEGANPKDEDSNNESGDPNKKTRRLEGFYEEHSIVKVVPLQNSLSASVMKCPETAKNILRIETDLPGDVVVHWGVCKDNDKKWEIPSAPFPAETVVFKNKALQTLLQHKEDGHGSWGLFTLDEGFVAFQFVLKIKEQTWLNFMENDFHIPLSQSRDGQSEGQGLKEFSEGEKSASSQTTGEKDQAVSDTAYTDGIINEIRNLVIGISSEKRQNTKSKEAQESILQEIEKLAAEAYSIFRSSIPTFVEQESKALETEALEALKPAKKICSGTGSGFEILCQGFNWESHKSGRWYMELNEKAAELSSLGFTVVWLPPPTESVSPEGYMPKDLYNLNSRYGSMDELKVLVKKFHEAGIKVLGDVVLNHRCAHYKNQNGVWNIFGGRLNWDDRAVVADDPHFQGRGNKSSGDNFHAAPNIDHSQDFVRKDLKEWLLWLREEVGYDGWRLDFVRGFWGGYVKDYLDATEPYFAVGEYWDSLSYTYGEMDHNQDAHRQRIIDWINATNGTAGAFDVTTKGILHAALDRCEYWRLSDQKGKPPGVVGWWPSRAVTFIENHDTGSTQGHWRFPGGKEMQGYAYILTHPGTPAVFYDHLFSHYHSEIKALLSIRNRNKIQCRSTVKITKTERDVYAAIIDKKVAMKIGPGHYEPPTESQKWSVAFEGKDYKVWEAS